MDSHNVVWSSVEFKLKETNCRTQHVAFLGVKSNEKSIVFASCFGPRSMCLIRRDCGLQDF